MNKEAKENLINWFGSIGLTAYEAEKFCEQNDFEPVEFSLYVLRQKLENAERIFLQATGKEQLTDFLQLKKQ